MHTYVDHTCARAQNENGCSLNVDLCTFCPQCFQTKIDIASQDYKYNRQMYNLTLGKDVKKKKNEELIAHIQ